MRRYFVLILILCALIYNGCISHPRLYNMPAWIKVLKQSGIAVREEPNPEALRIGAIYPDYSYDVLDVYTSWYKITLANNVSGWIYTNPQEKWVKTYKSGKIKITLKGGITVRKEPSSQSDKIGCVFYSRVYKLEDVINTWYKVRIPAGKSGWVYTGLPDEKWLEEIRP